MMSKLNAVKPPEPQTPMPNFQDNMSQSANKNKSDIVRIRENTQRKADLQWSQNPAAIQMKSEIETMSKQFMIIA
jgi:hypothetical protein